ncbi:MAG: hypothetical protein LCH54_16965 [Bacteroidetes bacterium]|nr:hypothetical protein [Bacteroidota bacterium]
MKKSLFLAGISISCIWQETILVKEVYFRGINGFPEKKTIAERIAFKGNTPVWKIDYANNGWQIVDSISFKEIEGKLLFDVFKPVYDFENQIIIGYKHSFSESKLQPILNTVIFEQDDNFRLAKSYLFELNYLMSLSPNQVGNEFGFKNGVLPLIFLKYGIPEKELLLNFNFKSNEKNWIIDDSFTYENYFLKRNYNYKDSMLIEIKITVENKKTNEILEFIENYRFE